MKRRRKRRHRRPDGMARAEESLSAGEGPEVKPHRSRRKGRRDGGNASGVGSGTENEGYGGLAGSATDGMDSAGFGTDEGTSSPGPLARRDRTRGPSTGNAEPSSGRSAK